MDEAGFLRAMREGKRPDGSAIDQVMRWPVIGRMIDDQPHAMWL